MDPSLYVDRPRPEMSVYDYAKLVSELGTNFVNIYVNEDACATSCKMLVEKGEDVNKTFFSGRTPLHIHACHSKCVELLLNAGADPNVQDKFGQTPLHCACSRGDEDGVRLLLEHSANPRLKDEDGHTPDKYTSNRSVKKLVRNYAPNGV